MQTINSRADLETLRGTTDFEAALRQIHGALTTWVLVDGSWVTKEDESILARLDYSKAQFMAEIAPFDFPDPVAPATLQIDLTAYAANKRFAVETGGIVINGQTIDTSRESQAMITGAYAYSQANPSETIQFKAVLGWITLDASTIEAIATAVGAHVQACFALEATVAAGIANGTITTTAEIDAAGWPE